VGKFPAKQLTRRALTAKPLLRAGHSGIFIFQAVFFVRRIDF
jgi:hypothetical protein